MLEFVLVLSVLNFVILFALSVFVLAKHFSTHQVVIAPTDNFQKPATDLSDYDVDERLRDYSEKQNGEIPDFDSVFNEMEIVRR